MRRVRRVESGVRAWLGECESDTIRRVPGEALTAPCAKRPTRRVRGVSGMAMDDDSEVDWSASDEGCSVAGIF